MFPHREMNQQMSFTTRTTSEMSDKPPVVNVIIPPQIISPENDPNEVSIRRAQSENFETPSLPALDSEEDDMVCMLN
jgi:hypothetical protein